MGLPERIRIHDRREPKPEAFGEFYHFRTLVPLDRQVEALLNRDTLYSVGVFDLAEPVAITKPDTVDRYQSMIVLNEDQCVKMFEYDPGEYTLTQDEIGTRYAAIPVSALKLNTVPRNTSASWRCRFASRTAQRRTNVHRRCVLDHRLKSLFGQLSRSFNAESRLSRRFLLRRSYFCAKRSRLASARRNSITKNVICNVTRYMGHIK
ncbi:DUF1254 domain-containing protein (plasmid) [Haloferacaceae archaeon DSL9]